MARSAAKAKAKPAAALPPAGQVPEGMKQIGGGYAPTWDVEKQAELLGTVTGEVRTVEMTIGRKKQERRCMEITDENGVRFTVWESAALGAFFDQVAGEGPGGEYYIRYDGLGKAKKGQNPPKLFTVAGRA